MKLPLNEAFVGWACASGLESQIVRAIRDEIDVRRGAVDQDTFFETLSAERSSAKGYWMRAVRAKRIVEPRALVKFLRLLRPAIEIDVRTEPWNRWSAGSRVIVVVGKREVSIPEVSTGVKQRAVGARDSEAFAELSRILYRDLGLDCEIVLEHLPARMTDAQALDALNRCRRSDDVGMICVLGSPVVNPLANALARQILADGAEAADREPLVRFRWAYKTSPDNFLADQKFPRGKSTWSPEEEGLAFPGTPTSYARESDDLIVKQAASRPSLAKRRFTDAGLLMMDCRSAPFLLLCAGHGGAGTLGCVRQLREKALIEDMLEATRASGSTPGRFSAVVQVSRERPKGVEGAFLVDDLEIVSSSVVWASVGVPGREWR